MNELVNERINGGLHWAIRLCRFLPLVGFLANRETNTDCGQNGKSMDSIHSTCRRWTSACVASSSLFHFSFDIPQSSCVSVEQVVHDGICAHRPTAIFSTTTKMWPDKSDGRSLFLSIEWDDQTIDSFGNISNTLCRVSVCAREITWRNVVWLVASSCSCLTRPKCVGERTRQCVGYSHGWVFILSPDTARDAYATDTQPRPQCTSEHSEFQYFIKWMLAEQFLFSSSPFLYAKLGIS